VGDGGVSGQDKVLAHYGAGLSGVGVNDLDEFFLIAEIKGRISTRGEEHDLLGQLLLRCRGQHAFSTDPEERSVAHEYLDLLGEKPDDAGVAELLDGWREELYKARMIYLGKRGRRARAEMEWVKFRLYLLALEERPSTVRGMYYRMVSKGFLPKDDRAYNLVQQTLLHMRRDGLLPWRWITDSSRRVWGHTRFGDLASYGDHIATNYRKDYWLDSPVNVEVWCEKDAMQGVIAPVVLGEFGLDLYVSKGQSSASYLYEAAESIKDDGRPTVVYILSDFDPAGFRIAEKIEAGLREHVSEEQELTTRRIAVSYEQVIAHDLVTREVKKSDKGAAEFLDRFGDISCELEAMPPNTLRGLLRDHLEAHMDKDRLRALKMVEEHERDGLSRIKDLLGGAA
jgi:hypothetical protein